jgi:Carboxypeptidase regulatory-like domain/TonB-dependent Receptor Plug Domain
MSYPAGNQRNYLSVTALIASLVTPALCPAQTTQGLIAGRVFDAGTKQPVANAVVEYFRREQDTVVESGSTHTNGTGLYAFSFLPPGMYHIRVCIASCDAGDRPLEGVYQPQEIYGLELFVGARLEVNFALRKLTEVWKAGIAQGLYQGSATAIIHYYASDVAQLRSAYLQLVPYRSASLGASLSYVVDPKSVTNLPLNGRDIYTALVLQPGVTAGTGTARGLGLSVNGQRPTASSYLLDGLDNNNTLVTGPLNSLAPEMIQEYRISTSSWSAEYGGSAGFLANAVTRAGGARWHGVGYFNLKNDALGANTFQDNALSVVRLPFKETQTGFQAGGPVWRQKLFFSAGLEKYRSRGYKEPQIFSVPSPLLVTRAATTASTLLTDFPTPAVSPDDGILSTISMRPSVTLDRYVGLARADYVSGARRVMLRTTVNRFDWPDFLWYPYKEFISGLTEPLDAVALGITDAVRPNLTHELHAGWSRSTIRWDRAHPEIPTIAVGATDPKQPPIVMPASPILYGLHYTTRNMELNDTWAWVGGSHIVKTGGGLLLRGINVFANTGQDGKVIFKSIGEFLSDQPAGYTAALNRVPLEFQLPPAGADNRTYRNRQYFLFGEDTWRLDRHLTLNAGLRWENFGSPVNTGPFKDNVVQLGAGANFAERLATAALISPPAGDQKLYAADSHNFAPRFGFTWDPGGRAPVIRGGYGIFYDRPFDNLFGDISANNIVIPSMIKCNPTWGGVAANLCRAYLAPVNTVLTQLQGSKIAQTFPSLRLIDPQLRSGYTQSYFLGLGKRVADSWEFELNTLGALGRRLLTTDVVNRSLSASAGAFNPALPEILWRSNQGASNYNALAAVARYRSHRGSLQVSYTWSHSIDNQSDPLVGDYWDLSFINIRSAAPNSAQAAFTQQFNSRGDRATSNFDQRHNLVFYSWWDVPSFRHGRVLDAITRGWHASQMAAFRTGFPYTVSADATGAVINQRADIVDPSQMFAVAGLPAAAGSVAILNRAAFAAPAFGVVGNSGRNAFRGPGLWDVDLSVSRSFALSFLGESGRMILRSDFYNAFNHANLNNPDAMYSSSSTTFGQARYGRLDYNSGAPAVAPLNETPRQIQLIVKLEF